MVWVAAPSGRNSFGKPLRTAPKERFQERTRLPTQPWRDDCRRVTPRRQSVCQRQRNDVAGDAADQKDSDLQKAPAVGTKSADQGRDGDHHGQSKNVKDGDRAALLRRRSSVPPLK